MKEHFQGTGLTFTFARNLGYVPTWALPPLARHCMKSFGQYSIMLCARAGSNTEFLYFGFRFLHNQTNKQSSKKSNNQTNNQTNKQTNKQSHNQPINQSVEQKNKQSVKQTINQSILQTNNQFTGDTKLELQHVLSRLAQQSLSNLSSCSQLLNVKVRGRCGRHIMCPRTLPFPVFAAVRAGGTKHLHSMGVASNPIQFTHEPKTYLPDGSLDQSNKQSNNHTTNQKIKQSINQKNQSIKQSTKLTKKTIIIRSPRARRAQSTRSGKGCPKTIYVASNGSTTRSLTSTCSRNETARNHHVHQPELLEQWQAFQKWPCERKKTVPTLPPLTLPQPLFRSTQCPPSSPGLQRPIGLRYQLGRHVQL